MGELSSGTISAVNSIAQEEWLHDESEHPYKFAPTKARGNTVPFPAIEKCNRYILRHFGAGIVEAIRQRIYDGDLAACFDVPDFTADCMSLRDCHISPRMSFWWQNRYEFLADLEVDLEADIFTEEVQDRRSCTVFVTLAFYFESRIFYTVEGISDEQPDRDGLRLDDYLIPIMSHEDVEKASEQQLFTYKPDALRDWRCIDAFQLAKAMGLQIMSLRLYRKPKTKSILYWTDSTVLVQSVCGDDDAPPVEITVPADTIVTNENIVPVNNRTLHIFHECFHAEYHWLFYRLQEMHNNDLRAIKKKRKVKNQGREPKNPLPILEWEAKRGSLALLIPRCISLPQFLQLESEEQQHLRHAGWALENVGRRVSEEWAIPKYLIRSRLIQLGFWQAQGSLNYVQQSKDRGSYIRPFMFDRESCPGTAHTFVIGPLEAFQLYERNKEYRTRIDTGNYVYVDGHICLNDPRYVVQGLSSPHMTEWANRHIDECCLRFENIYEVDENYEFHLNCINSDEEYNRHYNDFIARGDTLSTKEANGRQTELLSTLSHIPGKALRQLMDLRQMTNPEMAEAALISESTVKRWLKERASFNPTTALRIIVALHLPPWISYWFIDMAKVSLQYTGIHLLYREIINCRYMDSMLEINELIEASGYEKLRETV